jgi:hypothetical protein
MIADGSLHNARFGGMHWTADLPLPGFDAIAQGGADAIVVRRLKSLAERPVLRSVGRANIYADGVQFHWLRQVDFAIDQGRAIGWCPGPDWTGALPISFYSSVAAITLAMRGRVPLHASSVIVDDRAWVITGPGGSGKSTLTAELIAAGAQLLADDLTILSVDGAPLAWRGRPAVRLHPDSAAGIASLRAPEPASDVRGKLLVWPVSRAADTGWPIGGMIVLSDAAPAATSFARALFRPRIMAALPVRAQLHSSLFALAARVPVAVLPPVRGFGAAERQDRLARAMATIVRLRALS